MNLINSLFTLQKAVSDIPNLNRGGCGVFALAVVNKLKEMKINCRIRVANHPLTFIFGPEFRNDVLKDLEAPDVNSVFDANSKGAAIGHIFPEIEVDGQWRAFDSKYFLPTDSYLDEIGMIPYDGAMSVDVLERLANNPKGWNESFDRKNVKKIFAAADQAFA